MSDRELINTITVAQYLFETLLAEWHGTPRHAPQRLGARSVSKPSYRAACGDAAAVDGRGRDHGWTGAARLPGNDIG